MIDCSGCSVLLLVGVVVSATVVVMEITIYEVLGGDTVPIVMEVRREY